MRRYLTRLLSDCGTDDSSFFTPPTLLWIADFGALRFGAPPNFFSYCSVPQAALGSSVRRAPESTNYEGSGGRANDPAQPGKSPDGDKKGRPSRSDKNRPLSLIGDENPQNSVTECSPLDFPKRRCSVPGHDRRGVNHLSPFPCENATRARHQF